MKKRIGLFITITLMIFVIGMASMLLYVEKLRVVKDAPRGNAVVEIPFDFDAVQKPDEPLSMETETQTQEMSEEQMTLADMGNDLALYEEAVSMGQKALLAECAELDKVTFAFAGDILFDESYTIMYQYVARGGSVEDTFLSGLLEQMRAADVFMINNEFPFSERGTPTEGKQFTFRANPKHVAVFEQMGVDVVSLANNHAYDYGSDALLDTFDVLDAAKIPYVGAGRNLDEAMQPVYVIANGMKIAIVSATQIERNANPDTKEATATSAGVLRCLDSSALLKVIEQAEENSDFVILYIHWGTEGEEEIDWLQQEQSAVYAKAGVDLIIGDHPHCLQKIDVVEGVPVVYSLGNFWFNSRAQNTCLVEVTFNYEGIEQMRFLPCRHENCRTRLLAGEEAEGVLNYMRSISPNVLIDGDGYINFKN